MTYVDGFLIPVTKARLAAYRKAARLGEQVWMDHGALDYKECVADDLTWKFPEADGSVHERPSLFPKMVGAKRGETVVFSYIVFRSRAHRDAVNKKVMADPRMQAFDPRDMPVDMRRMGCAGFKAIVEAGATAPKARGRVARPARKSAGGKARTRSTGRGRGRARGRLESLPLSGNPF